MSFRQIYDMDVVPDAFAICSGVIVTKHFQLCSLACSNLSSVGHAIVGHTVWVLANQTNFVSTHRVEVTQTGHPPSGADEAKSFNISSM